MELLTFMFLGIAVVSVCGVALIVLKIIQEEREKKEKMAFVKAFNKKYNKRRTIN